MPAQSARRRQVRALSRSGALTLAAATALLCWACGGKEPPSSQRPAPAYGIPRQRTTSPAKSLPAATSQAQRFDPARPSEAARTPGSDQPPPTAAAEDSDAPGAKRERNYSAELTDLLGKTVPACLTSLAPSTNTVSVQVTAQVMPSGTISRAEAQGTGLTPTALACVKKAVGVLQLKGPVSDAPRSVQASLTLQAQRPANAPQPTAAADSREPNDDERDGEPRNSKIDPVSDDPPEVEQKLYEPTREGPEVPDPADEPPGDSPTD